MNEAKRKRLEQAGWTVGNADEFLELTVEESAQLDEMSEEPTRDGLTLTAWQYWRDRLVEQGMSEAEAIEYIRKFPPNKGAR